MSAANGTVMPLGYAAAGGYHRAMRRIRRADVLGLAAVATVGALVVLPLIPKAKREGNRATCMNNMRHIGFAALDYEGRKKRLPPAALPPDDLPPEDRLGWLMALTPYLEQEHVFRKGGAWDSEPNRSVAVPLKVFVCPAAPTRDTINTSFVGVTGVGPDAATLPAKHPRAGLFGYARKGLAVADIRDGASNTVLALEAVGGPWLRSGPASLRPVDPATRPHVGVGRAFVGPHKDWASLVRADGSAQFIDPEVAPEVLEALATVAGGETVPVDW